MGRIHANGAHKIYMRVISYLIYTLARGIYVLITAPLGYTNTKNQLKFRFAEADFLMNPPYWNIQDIGQDKRWK